MRIVLASFLLGVAFTAGCHTGTTPGSESSAASNVTVYKLRGKVVSSDTAHGIVMVDHEAIPGFMDAMTMPYKLKDPSIASELHPGDTITADVLVRKNAEEAVVLDHIVVIAQAQAGLQAGGLLSRAGAGRCGSGFQVAQPGRARDSSRSVSRQDAAGDIHLHALPAAQLLPAGDAQLCRDRSASWPRIRRSMPRRICCA